MFSESGTLYPDSLVGTDSHTTMINGLGILGWGKFTKQCTGIFSAKQNRHACSYKKLLMTCSSVSREEIILTRRLI